MLILNISWKYILKKEKTINKARKNDNRVIYNKMVW